MVGAAMPMARRRSPIAGLAVVALRSPLVPRRSRRAPKFSAPTNSSPITLSADGKLLWVVNPGGDNVSVINTGTNG